MTQTACGKWLTTVTENLTENPIEPIIVRQRRLILVIQIECVGGKAQRHADMSTLHFDPGIYVDISTFSILPEIQTRHGGERDGSKRVEKKGEEKIKINVNGILG